MAISVLPVQLMSVTIFLFFWGYCKSYVLIFFRILGFLVLEVTRYFVHPYHPSVVSADPIHY